MSHVVSRRALLGAAAALPTTVLPACTGGEDDPPAPARSRRVRVNTGLGLFQGREAYLYVARERGFFAEEGIEVEVLPGEGTEQNLKQLAAGQVDIATIDVNAGMVAFQRGEFTDFVLTAVLHTQHLGCVMVRQDSPIRRPRDLAGATIAVIPGGTNTVLFPAFAELAGFDDGGCEFVAPPPPSFGAVLAEGGVDAIQQFVVGRPNIEQAAGPARVFPYAEWLPELYGSALGCSRALAAEEPGLVRAFNRAALRGLEAALADPQRAGAIFEARDEEGQPAAVAAAENELLEPYTRLEDEQRGEFDQARLVVAAALLVSLGELDDVVDPAAFVAFDMFR